MRHCDHAPRPAIRTAAIMRLAIISAIGAWGWACASFRGATPPQAPEKVVTHLEDLQEPLIELASLDPTIVVDLDYATDDNVFKTRFYTENRCFVLRSVAERLVRAQQRLRTQGLGLKIWDAYRPLSVQRKMWNQIRDSRYVASPRKGSNHNRGTAVDVTLVDTAGQELPMPTQHDDFSPRSARRYADLDPVLLRNRAVLQEALTFAGFETIQSEWWHFEAPSAKNYPLIDVPLKEMAEYYDAQQ
ncbi:MAG: D-alanyl-D-alanine dipeptidase [bacterium]